MFQKVCLIIEYINTINNGVRISDTKSRPQGYGPGLTAWVVTEGSNVKISCVVWGSVVVDVVMAAVVVGVVTAAVVVGVVTKVVAVVVVFGMISMLPDDLKRVNIILMLCLN